MLAVLFNTAQCLSFLSLPTLFKKQWAFCQCTSCIFSNNPTSPSHPKTHTHTQTYSPVHAHTNTQIQTHLWGVPKRFRSGRLDTETQETIGCQKGPWACLSHISRPCAIAYWAVVTLAVLQSTETNLHLVPPLPLLTKKWAGISLSQDGRVVDTQREMLRPWTLWMIVLCYLFLDSYSKKRLSDARVILYPWNVYDGIRINS